MPTIEKGVSFFFPLQHEPDVAPGAAGGERAFHAASGSAGKHRRSGDGCWSAFGDAFAACAAAGCLARAAGPVALTARDVRSAVGVDQQVYLLTCLHEWKTVHSTHAHMLQNEREQSFESSCLLSFVLQDVSADVMQSIRLTKLY